MFFGFCILEKPAHLFQAQTLVGPLGKPVGTVAVCPPRWGSRPQFWLLLVAQILTPPPLPPQGSCNSHSVQWDPALDDQEMTTCRPPSNGRGGWGYVHARAHVQACWPAARAQARTGTLLLGRSCPRPPLGTDVEEADAEGGRTKAEMERWEWAVCSGPGCSLTEPGSRLPLTARGVPASYQEGLSAPSRWLL